MMDKFMYVLIIESRYGRFVSVHNSNDDAFDAAYKWVEYNWDISSALHEIDEDKEDAVASYFNFYEGESYSIYPARVSGIMHDKSRGVLTEAISSIRFNFDTFLQGLLESDGDFGMTYDDPPNYDMQNAYDMGRDLGRSLLKRAEIGG